MNAKIIENLAFRNHVFVFQDRFQAGKLLAEKLQMCTLDKNAIVLAIPAGGVPVGYGIARELKIQMDIVIVRKIQIPWNTEAGFGAVTWDSKIVLNKDLVTELNLTEEEIETSILKTKKNIQERIRKFRGEKPLPNLTGKTVILVDDGLASGFTMLAVERSVREKLPKKIIVAVPTASLGAIKMLANEVDEIVCLNIVNGSSYAVANAYEKWYDLSDEEVIDTLRKV